jgi:large subunit ribosomal protein L3
MRALYGTKIGMTRIYQGDEALPVTVIEVLPNEVVEVKTADKHGYAALKVACGPVAKKAPAKALGGEYTKAEVAPRRFLREIPAVDGVGVGGKLTVTLLEAGKVVDVVGVTKGRGFAGVMKRHNFSGHKATHGTQVHRGPGSIGCRMDPGKVHKNKRMPGHYGVEQVTIRNLDIVSIDTERNLVLIKGSIPGPNGGLVSIRQR